MKTRPTLRIALLGAVTLGVSTLALHETSILRASAHAQDAAPAPSQSVQPASAAQASPLVQRGEYLARAADCVACHTAPGGKAYAGGLPFKLPFGTMYATNITADRETGIGSWSDDDFVNAVRKGVGKGGKHLYPSMPYTSYTAMSRDDALAIKAYLFSLPAVRQPNRANHLAFPFNQRWSMWFWNLVFLKDRRFQPDPALSAEENRGAYLATALGHCGECHTPRNLAFAMKANRQFAGAELQGWRAWNITPDKRFGVGGWSDAQLADYLAAGHANGRGSAAGPMGEAVENSLQYLTPQDTAALVAYLRKIPAQPGEAGTEVDLQPAPVLASSAWAPGAGDTGGALGKHIFEGACASCHQWNGQGQQTPYAALLGSQAVNDPTGLNVVQVMLHGAHMRVRGQTVFMPVFGRGYSDGELAAVANYVVSHFGGKPGRVTPEAVAKARTAG
ncbi:cytochrome c [Caulobacter sp. S45]|uniref:cytochrome c n=1 Tax=Caulobacter sp. S45 TaxID=1641861 RepID=UPI001C208819|nr:cytochrome c [Caulobacter sp. S45]